MSSNNNIIKIGNGFIHSSMYETMNNIGLNAEYELMFGPKDNINNMKEEKKDENIEELTRLINESKELMGIEDKEPIIEGRGLRDQITDPNIKPFNVLSYTKLSELLGELNRNNSNTVYVNNGEITDNKGNKLVLTKSTGTNNFISKALGIKDSEE